MIKLGEASDICCTQLNHTKFKDIDNGNDLLTNLIKELAEPTIWLVLRELSFYFR
jgi:hypothetical protein